MQIQIKHISTGEGSLRRGREKQFIHRLSTQDPNGWFGGGCGRVSSNDQANTGARRQECYVGAIEEDTVRTTLRMGRVVIWWLLETGSHRGQIEQAIVFATDDDSHPGREGRAKNGCCAIQSIQADQDVRQWHTQPARIADDGLTGPDSFATIVPIARPPECAQPVVGVSLEYRRSGPSHLSSLASEIGGSTDLVKASMGSWKFGKRGKGSLSCGLFGPIHIHDQPVLAQTIPQSAWWEALSGPSHEILLKERSQCLDRWLIQGGKKATERGAMGQSMPIEECHEGGGKRGQSLIKCQKGRFCTYRISKEHHHKINHLIRAESRACKTDPFLDGFEKTRCPEELCYYRHLSKPAGKRGSRFWCDLNVYRSVCHTSYVSSLLGNDGFSPF